MPEIKHEKIDLYDIFPKKNEDYLKTLAEWEEEGKPFEI